VEEGLATPSHGLFQPYYPLSEADYLRLKGTGILYGLGGGVFGFGLTYLLPIVIPYFLALIRHQGYKLSPLDLSVGLGISVVGLIMIGMGKVMSGDKRKVLKSIDEHFSDNPARPEIRVNR
jgi:hypothetical protein